MDSCGILSCVDSCGILSCVDSCGILSCVDSCGFLGNPSINFPPFIRVQTANNSCVNSCEDPCILDFPPKIRVFIRVCFRVRIHVA